MSYDDKGLTELVAEVEEQLVEFGFVLTVERSAGFVGKDDSRLVDECSCNSYTLFFATGELVWLVTGAVGEPHKLQQLLSTLSGLTVFFAGDIGGNQDVFKCCKLWQQLVELEDESEMLVTEVGELLAGKGGYIDGIDVYTARIRLFECTDDLQQRGLSRSAGTDDADDLSFVDMEVDAFENL